MAKPEDSGRAGAQEEKRNTSLRLEGRTLKALKLRAVEEGTSVQKIVERLIEEYLKSGGTGRA
jgi:predicted DNA binding CopG/RHH family protein